MAIEIEDVFKFVRESYFECCSYVMCKVDPDRRDSSLMRIKLPLLPSKELSRKSKRVRCPFETAKPVVFLARRSIADGTCENRLGISRLIILFGDSFLEFVYILFLVRESDVKVGLTTFDRAQFRKSFLSPDFVPLDSELLVRVIGLVLSFEILFT